MLLPLLADKIPAILDPHICAGLAELVARELRVVDTSHGEVAPHLVAFEDDVVNRGRTVASAGATVE